MVTMDKNKWDFWMNGEEGSAEGMCQKLSRILVDTNGWDTLAKALIEKETLVQAWDYLSGELSSSATGWSCFESQ